MKQPTDHDHQHDDERRDISPRMQPKLVIIPGRRDDRERDDPSVIGRANVSVLRAEANDGPEDHAAARASIHARLASQSDVESTISTWAIRVQETCAAWRAVTYDDIERADGEIERLYDIIADRIGEAKDTVRDRLERKFGRYA